MKNNLLKWILCILLSFLIGWFSSRSYYYEPPIEIHDTIQVDSIRVVEKTRLINVTTFDTTYLFVHDTITDTIRLEIPIEHKEYLDTFRTDTSEIDLKVKYSGFKPSLDEISITNHYWGKEPVKQPKIKAGQSIVIGPSISYGLSLSNQPRPSPFIGVSLTYGFGITW